MPSSKDAAWYRKMLSRKNAKQFNQPIEAIGQEVAPYATSIFPDDDAGMRVENEADKSLRRIKQGRDRF